MDIIIDGLPGACRVLRRTGTEAHIDQGLGVRRVVEQTLRSRSTNPITAASGEKGRRTGRQEDEPVSDRDGPSIPRLH